MDFKTTFIRKQKHTDTLTRKKNQINIHFIYANFEK